MIKSKSMLGEEIGLPHALHLSNAEKTAWGQIFGDYQIIIPVIVYQQKLIYCSGPDRFSACSEHDNLLEFTL